MSKSIDIQNKYEMPANLKTYQLLEYQTCREWGRLSSVWTAERGEGRGRKDFFPCLVCQRGSSPSAALHHSEGESLTERGEKRPTGHYWASPGGSSSFIELLSGGVCPSWAVCRVRFPHCYKLMSAPPPLTPPLYNCGNEFENAVFVHNTVSLIR